jgi:enoyl-CoA hydratase/carnithine racemase
MDYQTLKYDIDDGLLLLTLNRPDQLNAFTVQMADELVAAYERASLDDAVRVIVVTGAGKAFCAGMDLSVGRQRLRPRREPGTDAAGHARAAGGSGDPSRRA